MTHSWTIIPFFYQQFQFFIDFDSRFIADKNLINPNNLIKIKKNRDFLFLKIQNISNPNWSLSALPSYCFIQIYIHYSVFCCVFLKQNFGILLTFLFLAVRLTLPKMPNDYWTFKEYICWSMNKNIYVMSMWVLFFCITICLVKAL